MRDIQYPEADPNKKSAQEVWNQHYQGENYFFGKEAIAFLKSYVESLKQGAALDVAMGEGRNAVFLASKGFSVEGIDGSKVAVEKAIRLAQEKNVQLEAKTQNLDFFLMPLMKYDTIMMNYYRPQARFFSEIRRGLKAGGTFLLEAYTVEHYKKHTEKLPWLTLDQCYKPNEVLSLVKDLNILYYREIPDHDSHTVQVIAKKYG